MLSDYRLDPPEKIDYPDCPVCGTSLYDYVVLDNYGDVVGCSECTRQLSAEEYIEHLGEEE